MVKKQKKTVPLNDADTEDLHLQAFKNSLRSALKEVLNSWVTYENGAENIRSWVGLSPDEVAAAAVQSKVKSAKNETTPVGFYTALLRSTASCLKKNTQFNKKQIIQKCIECHDYIQSIIKDFVETNEKSSDFISSESKQTSEECSEDLTTNNKKKRKSELILVKSSKKKSKAEDGDISESNQQLFSDEEETQFMDSIPDEIKQDFRELGFSKWGKDWLPVLILSPYDVDVSLRDQWKSKYEKFKKKKGPFEHIFYWYGAKNESEYYGFAKQSELKLYEEAEKQNLHITPKRLETKKTSGKKLSAPEQNIIDGLGEIKQALSLSKANRWRRVGAVQVTEESIEEEMTQDETPEISEDIEVPQPIVKHQESEGRNKLQRNHLKKKINTKEEMKEGGIQELSEKIDEPQPILKEKISAKKKKPESKKKDVEKSTKKKKREVNKNIREKDVAPSSESIKSEGKPAIAVADEFEAELSEKEDSEFLKGQSSIIDSTNKSRTKEVPLPCEDYAALEEKAFRLNEKEILPIMRELQLSIDKKKSEEANANMEELKKILPTITPLFIERHPIGKLLKTTRQAFYNQEKTVEIVRGISQSMKEIYNEKIKNREESTQEIHEGNRKQNSGTEDVENDACVTENILESSRELPLTTPITELTELQTIHTKTESIPRKGSSSKTEQQSVVPHPVAITKASVPLKPSKPKFSLGAMIDGSKQASVSSAAKEYKPYSAASTVLATSKKGPPGWLTEELPDSVSDPTSGDDVRSLGKEFIEAIDADWPNDVLEQINVASFVYHVEKAIHEWSQEEQGHKSRSSNRAPVKPLLQYPENYWVKIRDVVAGLSGDRLFNKPKLVEWMLRGDYETPMDLIKVPGIIFYESMKNLS